MNGNEIAALLKEKFNIDKLAYNAESLIKEDVALYELLGEVKCVDFQERSSEGDHDTQYTRYYFEKHDAYVELSGYYSSHDSGDFDEIYGVTPKEITVTIYEKIK